MEILAIETSCDETALAVLEVKGKPFRLLHQNMDNKLSEFQNEILRLAADENFKVVSIFSRIKNDTKTSHDYLGVRVILNSMDNCSTFSKKISENFSAVNGRYRDFISNPWDDGYRSIHIDIVYKNIPAEIQIRTEEMDLFAKKLIDKKGEHYWRK